MVRRDIHALAVLFIMPMAFILIMSLSLQSTMDSSAEIRPEIGLWIENINEPLKNKVEKLEGFKIRTYHDKKEAIGSAKRDEIKAVISIPDNANSITNGKNRKANNEPRIRIYIAPSTSYQLRQLIHVSLASLLSAEKINELVSRQKPTKTDPNKLYSELIKTQELFERQGEKVQPTSVQH
jgi:ABC-2 type transport system permease protein